jgi:hypothetical protein
MDGGDGEGLGMGEGRRLDGYDRWKVMVVI